MELYIVNRRGGGVGTAAGGRMNGIKRQSSLAQVKCIAMESL